MTSIWNNYLTLYHFWEDILDFAKGIRQDYQRAISFVGNEGTLWDKGDQDLFDHSIESVDNPSKIDLDSISLMKSDLRSLWKQLKELDGKISQAMEKKRQDLDEMLVNSVPIQATRCYKAALKEKEFSLSSIDSKSTYAAKHQEIRSLEEEAEKLGKQKFTQRCWDIYKRLFNHMVKLDKDPTDIVNKEIVTQAQLDELKKKGLINYEVTMSYAIKGFENCKEIDLDEE